jgi:hypothetical protein
MHTTPDREEQQSYRGGGGRGMSWPAEGAAGDGGAGLQKGRRFPLSPARCASASLCLPLNFPLSPAQFPFPPARFPFPFTGTRQFHRFPPRFPPKNPANCPGRATQPPVTTPRRVGRRLFSLGAHLTRNFWASLPVVLSNATRRLDAV